MNFLHFNCQGEASPSAYFSFYVIVILLDDRRYKWMKHVVEDK